MPFRPSSVAWALCLLAGLSLLGFYIGGTGNQRPDSIATSTDFGGPFALTDHHGNRVTEKSWPGQYLLLYFGFLHCPDVCPTGLNKLAQAMNQLPEETAAKIQPLLITVDPERDDAESLKLYVDLFHPRLIGLTGTPEQIDHVKAAFKVYAQKDGNGKDYMVNHSAFTYLLDPDGELAGLYSHDITADDMAKQIKQTIK